MFIKNTTERGGVMAKTKTFGDEGLETKGLKEEGFQPPNALEFAGGDKRYAYRWVKENSINARSGRDVRGWEKVTDTTSAGESVTESGLADKGLDGSIKTGDLVLARMSKERAEKRNRYYRERQLSKMQVINQFGKDANGMRPEYSVEEVQGGKYRIKETNIK